MCVCVCVCVCGGGGGYRYFAVLELEGSSLEITNYCNLFPVTKSARVNYNTSQLNTIVMHDEWTLTLKWTYYKLDPHPTPLQNPVSAPLYIVSVHKQGHKGNTRLFGSAIRQNLVRCRKTF